MICMSKYSNLVEFVQPDQLSNAIEGFKFNFLSCGRWKVTHHKKVESKTLPYYRIAYIVEGKVNFTYGSKEHSLKKGDVLLTRPNALYAVEVLDPNTEFLFIYFTLSTAYLESEFLNIIGYHHSPIVYHTKEKSLYYLFCRILEEFEEKNPGYYLLCQNLFKAICIHVYREQANKTDSTISIEIDDVRNVLFNATKFIQDHIYKRITVEMIASHVNFSSSYLFNIFKEKLNMSPQKYIASSKINKAKELLEYSDYSISELASMLGFSSSQHFSKAFKNHTGLTPSEARQNYRPKSNGDVT